VNYLTSTFCIQAELGKALFLAKAQSCRLAAVSELMQHGISVAMSMMLTAVVHGRETIAVANIWITGPTGPDCDKGVLSRASTSGTLNATTRTVARPSVKFTAEAHVKTVGIIVAAPLISSPNVRQRPTGPRDIITLTHQGEKCNRILWLSLKVQWQSM